MYNFIKTILEGKTPKTLEQASLPYAKDGLGRSISKATIDYHYSSLYKAYVDRYNKGEGDDDFNEAGAFLHNIYFGQLKSPEGSNRPYDAALQFVEKHFKTFDLFKNEVEKAAMKIQGSGWVYLAKDGEIKTIVNHEIRNDIVLLIDWWEHAWALDYQADKKSYLSNAWKIIDWRIINGVLGQSN
jgi:Fe-Mn family superoxide dismutase